MLFHEFPESLYMRGFREFYPVGLRPGRFYWPIAQLFDRDGQED